MTAKRHVEITDLGTLFQKRHERMITCCRDCPHLFGLSDGTWACITHEGNRMIPDPGEMPGWCPLEDWKEE